MIKEIIFAFWFFVPAGLATVAAMFSGKIAYLKSYSYPADFFLKFRGKRLFGEHKTIRGFIVGIVVAIITVYLQIFLFQHLLFLRNSIPLNYNLINPIIFGSLIGFGAMFGDALKSFFKRQIGILPGKSWFPFDQSDYILGGIVLSACYIRLSLWQYVLVFVVWFLIHPITTIIGYLLKLKESPL